MGAEEEKKRTPVPVRVRPLRPPAKREIREEPAQPREIREAEIPRRWRIY